MANKERSQSEKDGRKRNLGSLNYGRTKRLEDKVKHRENELEKAKETGNKIAMGNAYEDLEVTYEALGMKETALECKINKLKLRLWQKINTLNHSRRERYEGTVKFMKKNEKAGLEQKYEASKVLERTFAPMLETERAFYHEKLEKLWSEIESQRQPMWMKTSEIHRDKFKKLIEYSQNHSEKMKNINGVRVSFREEFCVGKGSDGTAVYIGLAEDGCEKAVKRMVKSNSGMLGSNEKKILNSRNAVNSKRVVNYWYYDEQSDEDFSFLILDLDEENLEQYVETQSQEILTTNAPVITRSILKGLNDLHDKPKPILHRDLKPSNILRNVQGDWLLADFGISRELPEGKTTHITKESGTKYWRAVESYDGGRYKKQSDIQVAGMVVFHILTKGGHPFGDEADRHRNLLDGNPVGLDNLADPVAKDLISWMLKHDPKDRPSAKEALKHPYLQPADQQFELLKCVGNEREMKQNPSSDFDKELKHDPLLNTTWKSHIPSDVLTYFCCDINAKHQHKYGDEWTACLRLIRNMALHRNDLPRPEPKVLNDVGEPMEYFLKVFPILPVVVHRIIRSKEGWKNRENLKKFF